MPGRVVARGAGGVPSRYRKGDRRGRDRRRGRRMAGVAAARRVQRRQVRVARCVTAGTGAGVERAIHSVLRHVVRRWVAGSAPQVVRGDGVDNDRLARGVARCAGRVREPIASVVQPREIVRNAAVVTPGAVAAVGARSRQIVLRLVLRQ